MTAPSVDLPVPDRVLAIGAHADDVEFGAGGTLAKWSTAGAAVHLLVLTDGSKGTWERDTDPGALVEQRRQEQQRAVEVLGIERLTCLGLVDGELAAGLPERALVCAAIRRSHPDVVVGHDPWKRYRLHPDHRHAGLLTLDAIVAARDPRFFPDQHLDPHRPERLLLFEAEVVDHLERVGEHVARKIEALLCHRSQWRSTMGIDDDGRDVTRQRADFARRIRDEARAAGDAIGVPAEAFKLLENL